MVWGVTVMYVCIRELWPQFLHSPFFHRNFATDTGRTAVPALRRPRQER